MTDHAEGFTAHPGSGSGVVPADNAASADGPTVDEHAPGPDPARRQEHQRRASQEEDFALETMGDDDEPHEEMLQRLRATRATLAARRRATFS